MGNLGKKDPGSFLWHAGGNLNAYKDGRISPRGEQHAVDAVMEMEEDVLRQIASAEVALASPLVRSLATCVITLATAYKRLGMEPAALPRIVTVTEMREKVASESDVPGTNAQGAEDYLRGIAETYGERYFGDGAVLRPWIEHAISSYEAERERTSNWGRGSPAASAHVPNTAEKFARQIRRFRERLGNMTETRVFMVGHNGWSRWAFAAWLLPPCLGADRGAPGSLERVAFGGRQLRELDNLGLLTATFSMGSFQYADQPLLDKAALEPCAKKTKFGLFTSIDEAKAAGLVPQDALVHQMAVLRDGKESTVSFSSVGNRTFLALGDKFATPVNYIDLVEQHLPAYGIQYACDYPDHRLIHIGHAKHMRGISAATYLNQASIIKPFHLRAKSPDDFARLCKLLNIHMRFATDTAFIRDILGRAGWDSPTQHVKSWEKEWQRVHPFIAPHGPSNLNDLLHQTGIYDPFWNEHREFEENGLECHQHKFLGFVFAEWCD